MCPTALITGASEGIGEATAILLAKNGYDLIIAARGKDKLDAVAENIKTLGRQVLTIPTDVSDRSAVQALINSSI
jgi:short-subunit dehydrogenase